MSSVVTANEVSVEQSANKYSLGINPLGFLVGSYGAEVGYTIDDNMVVGIEGSYNNFSMLNLKTTGYGVGAFTTYSINGVSESGLYARGGLRFVDQKVSTDKGDLELRTQKNDLIDSAAEKSLTVSAIAGYQWFFASDLSLDFGVGIQAKVYGDEDVSDGVKFVDTKRNKESDLGKAVMLDARLGLNILI